MAQAAQPKIEVGTSWTAGGRVWTVYELMPFGKAKVRSGMRFGEMYYRGIHAAMAQAASASA